MFIPFAAAITPRRCVSITIQFYVEHRHFGGAVNRQMLHILNGVVYR